MPPKVLKINMAKIYIKPENNNNSNGGEKNSSDESNGSKKHKSSTRKNNIWAIKITIVTLCLSLVFSFITEITASKANVIIAMILLLFLIAINIIFDGIGIAAASCELAPLLSMSAKKVPGAKIAVMLVKNAEKVSNICADVIGDICGIISGASTITIVIKLLSDSPNYYIFNIILSSVVAALTVGGKAFIKKIAISNSKEMILFASRIIDIFYKPKGNK